VQSSILTPALFPIRLSAASPVNCKNKTSGSTSARGSSGYSPHPNSVRLSVTTSRTCAVTCANRNGPVLGPPRPRPELGPCFVGHKTAERHGPTSILHRCRRAIGEVNNKTTLRDSKYRMVRTIPSARKMRREIFLLLYCLEAVCGAAHPAPTPAARLEKRSPTGLLNVESVWSPLTLGTSVSCIVLACWNKYCTGF
jgi:hypothetical protein